MPITQMTCPKCGHKYNLSAQTIEEIGFLQCSSCEFRKSNPIEERVLKRKEDLKIFKAALKVLDIKERAYAHCDGRLREISNELIFLAGLQKSESKGQTQKNIID